MPVDIGPGPVIRLGVSSEKLTCFNSAQKSQKRHLSKIRPHGLGKKTWIRDGHGHFFDDFARENLSGQTRTNGLVTRAAPPSGANATAVRTHDCQGERREGSPASSISFPPQRGKASGHDYSNRSVGGAWTHPCDLSQDRNGPPNGRVAEFAKSAELSGGGATAKRLGFRRMVDVAVMSWATLTSGGWLGTVARAAPRRGVSASSHIDIPFAWDLHWSKRDHPRSAEAHRPAGLHLAINDWKHLLFHDAAAYRPQLRRRYWQPCDHRSRRRDRHLRTSH